MLSARIFEAGRSCVIKRTTGNGYDTSAETVLSAIAVPRVVHGRQLIWPACVRNSTRCDMNRSRRSSLDLTSLRRRHAPTARTSIILAAIALLGITLRPDISPAAESDIDPVTGYRVANYRSPTPQTVPGGTTVTLEQLTALVQIRHAILIDVMSADGAVPDPHSGVWQLSKPRHNLEGSVWLPDVGRGTLTPDRIAYFRDNLERLTGGDKARPIVFYCQADCWMSWNAVKRAAVFGYTALYWYPDGTDGMADWDVELVEAVPVPLAVSVPSEHPRPPTDR